MFQIDYISEADKSFWFALDKLLSQDEFKLKIRDKRGYVIFDEDRPSPKSFCTIY